MGFFSNWPFSNLHNLNLDWLIEQVKKLTVVSDQIWERVKPFPGGDPSTITAAQAYEHASTALNSAANVGAEGAKTKAKLNEHTDNHNNPHGVTPEQIGAEPKITLLEISKGGTGGFNPVTARASLGARADFTILPVSDGGTGSSTPAGARDALGITPANIGAKPAFDVLPISQGGTGSNTPEGARDALGAFPKSGGMVDGYIDFGQQSNGMVWTTSDGTIVRMRPYVPTNLFQITLAKPGGSEISPFMMSSDGDITLGNVSIGHDNKVIRYWQLADSSGFSFLVNGEEKCSLGFNSDRTITVNGKKILTEA